MSCVDILRLFHVGTWYPSHYVDILRPFHAGSWYPSHYVDILSLFHVGSWYQSHYVDILNLFHVGTWYPSHYVYILRPFHVGTWYSSHYVGILKLFHVGTWYPSHYVDILRLLKSGTHGTIHQDSIIDRLHIASIWLTHWGLTAPIITWTNDNFSFVRLYGIHLRAIFQPVPKLILCMIKLKIILINYCHRGQRVKYFGSSIIDRPWKSLQWRHNGRVGVSNHQPHDCLFNCLSKALIKENNKAPRHWPLCGEFTGGRWITRTNGQYRGKWFHLMTSSCTAAFRGTTLTTSATKVFRVTKWCRVGDQSSGATPLWLGNLCCGLTHWSLEVLDAILKCNIQC